jgi:hypothetical protein
MWFRPVDSNLPFFNSLLNGQKVAQWQQVWKLGLIYPDSMLKFQY